MTRIEAIQYFFDTHQAIDRSKFAREAEIPRSVLRRILEDGSTPRNYEDMDKLEPVMRKYGWEGEVPETCDNCDNGDIVWTKICSCCGKEY